VYATRNPTRLCREDAEQLNELDNEAVAAAEFSSESLIPD
jgi:hypothetical protein